VPWRDDKLPAFAQEQAKRGAKRWHLVPRATKARAVILAEITQPWSHPLICSLTIQSLFGLQEHFYKLAESSGTLSMGIVRLHILSMDFECKTFQ
jgi:hypothetical protein